MRRFWLMILPGVLGLIQWAAGAGMEPALFQHDYPRFFQFRYAESLAASGKYSYEDWDRLYKPFDGIEGKVFDEEVPGRAAALPYFTRFKQEHPEKMVLIHINGRSRDPRDTGGAYFAGHWLYYNGCKLLTSLRAETGELEITVENPNFFRTNMGLNGNSNEDLVIYTLIADGKPDWNHAEQVELLAMDKARKTLRIRRAAYNSKPLAFSAGKAIVAAHVTEGPWGKNSHLLWSYNFSPDSPRDAQGRNCLEVRANELIRLFNPGGPLAGVDGMEFDVLMGELATPAQRWGPRGIDSDGDGQIDNGWREGINRFGIGVYEFLKQLRNGLGDSRIIQADGMGPKHQRAFDQLNGIESEGWPVLTDVEVNDWSGGLNRHFYWNENARPPRFSYINHKFRAGHEEPIFVPKNINRLVLAAAQFTEAVFTYADFPTPFDGKVIPVWDELVKGAENKQGWLGKPLGPPLRLARNSPDLFKSKGVGLTPEFIASLNGEGIRFTPQGKELMVMATAGQKPERLIFHLKGIPTDGSDLTLFFTIRAEPMAGYPAAMARVVRVNIAGEDKKKALMSWAGSKPFVASFYFREIKTKMVELEFEVEGGGRIWLSGFSAHAAPDAILREFQYGLVLGNPALHEVEFDLAKLTPGKLWQRFKGTTGQDPAVNNGVPVGAKVLLPARDGLFLGKK